MGEEGELLAKEFIADPALIVLVAWAMADVQRKPKF